jgi:hypothetical protein
MTPLQLYKIQKFVKNNIVRWYDCTVQLVDPFVQFDEYSHWIRHFKQGGGAGFLVIVEKEWNEDIYGSFK